MKTKPHKAKRNYRGISLLDVNDIISIATYMKSSMSANNNQHSKVENSIENKEISAVKSKLVNSNRYKLPLCHIFGNDH